MNQSEDEVYILETCLNPAGQKCRPEVHAATSLRGYMTGLGQNNRDNTPHRHNIETLGGRLRALCIESCRLGGCRLTGGKASIICVDDCKDGSSALVMVEDDDTKHWHDYTGHPL